MITIRISQYPFYLQERYREGTVITKEEAQVLNSAMANNIRDKVDSVVQAAIGAFGEPLPLRVLEALQDQVTETQTGYRFQPKQQQREKLGAFELEIRAVAEERALALGFAQDLPGWLTVLEDLALQDDIRAKALERLAAQRLAASAALFELGLFPEEGPADD